MLQFSYLTWRRFIAKIFSAFGEFYTPKEAMSFDELEQIFEDEDEQSKFKVSLNDLKIISSALLFYKKSLLKKNELVKADRVAALDNRLYQLIVDLENVQLQEKEENAVVA